MSDRNPEVWKLARELTIEIQEMSLELPDLEKQEEGQQNGKFIRPFDQQIISNLLFTRYFS